MNPLPKRSIIQDCVSPVKGYAAVPDISFKSIKNRIQGTATIIQDTASAALNELIKPLGHPYSASNGSDEMSMALDMDKFNFDHPMPLSLQDIQKVVKHHPEFELMYSGHELTADGLLTPWIGESDLVKLCHGVISFEDNEYIGVTVQMSNMRILFLPVVNEHEKDNESAYVRRVCDILFDHGLAFVMRGHLSACSVEKLVYKKRDERASSADALAMNLEVLLGVCVHFTLLSGKTLKLIVGTSQLETVELLRDVLENQFRQFDPDAFKPETENRTGQVEGSIDLYLPGLHIFAVFDPMAYYASWGGLHDGNANYSLCDSYPPFLPLGGLQLNEAQLYEIAKFRSRGRLPVLSFRSAHASMWRCSQPQTSVLGKRCGIDEWMIRLGLHRPPNQAEVSVCVDESSPTERVQESVLHIYDARPFVNAFANKIAGAGYESTDQYQGCTIDFASIENIHKVSASYNSLREIVLRYFDVNRRDNLRHTDKAVSQKLLSEIIPRIYQTGWFDHIHALLKASYQIASLLNNKETVLVHCSDGWDRTAQLTFLSLIFLSSEFRTVKGFCLLLEKEFAWLGHMLNTRLGLGPVSATCNLVNAQPKDHQGTACPILVQLFECTAHILKQAPEEFEFNERFLVCLAHHVYAKIWGDFAFDTHRVRLCMPHFVPL